MCTPEDINRYLLEMLETLKILTWYCQKFYGGSFEEMVADVGSGLLTSCVIRPRKDMTL